LGTPLESLGEREGGTARFEEAVKAYRAALEVMTRERVPLDWAKTQNNLAFALWRLGERESGTARLNEAIAAYRAALEERTRDRVPLDSAQTQMNLGDALQTLSERVGGTAQLEEAVTAWTACLDVTTSVWPTEWIRSVENRRDQTKAEIARRSPQ
jgi:tetratricopeptide (TPR) repeat protein